MDGGQYEAFLAVPPELYDRASAEFNSVIDRACANLIGAGHYCGLTITLRRAPVDPDWIATIVGALNPRWVSSERVDAGELEHAEA